MKNFATYILFVVAFPFFTAAWFAANALHLPGADDMPAPGELIDDLKNI